MPLDTPLRNEVRAFDVHDADWICLLNERNNPAESLAGRQAEYLSKIRRASLLTEPPDQLSVIGVSFDAGFHVRTHYHDVDQFLFIVEGEFRMGRHRLHPGHGAYMPAGNPYNAQVGRAGGTFLEFREVPFYRTAFVGPDADQVGAGTPKEIAGWQKPEPKKGKTSFFDVETCAAIACPGFGPGDGERVPQSLAGALHYQALHAGPGYSMHSVIADAGLVVPSHRQDADKIIYLLAGELAVADGTETVLRPGGGIHISSQTRVQLRIGPAGAKYLEFRKQPAWRTDWLTH